MATHGPRAHEKTLGHPYLHLLATMAQGWPDAFKCRAYVFFRPEATADYARRKHAREA